MPFGLALSLLFHAALLGWALFSMRSVSELTPDTPAIAADIISPSEFLRLKQGSEDAKKLETKAKEEPKPDDSKNDTAKPSNAPPLPRRHLSRKSRNSNRRLKQNRRRPPSHRSPRPIRSQRKSRSHRRRRSPPPVLRPMTKSYSNRN